MLDNETRDILVKILEGQGKLEEGQSKLESEVKRNSIKLESIEKDIKIIVEVHTSHKDQNEISFKNTNSIIEENTGLIETAVKSVSKDVKEVKESIEVLKNMTGRHEVDINILKRRTV